MSVIFLFLKKVKLTHILISVCVSLVSYITFLEYQARKSSRVINNLKVDNETVKNVFEDSTSIWERRAYQYKDILKEKAQWIKDFETITDSRNTLEINKTRLLKEIEDKDEEIIILNNVILTSKPVTVQGKADTTIIYVTDEGVREQIYIDIKIGSIGLKGWTMTNPAEYKFDAWLNPVGVQVYVTEHKLNYSAYLLFSDNNIKVPLSNVYVNSDIAKESLKDRLTKHFGLGALSFINLYAGFEYDLKNERMFYTRLKLPVWRLNQHLKLSGSGMTFLTEFKLWGR